MPGFRLPRSLGACPDYRIHWQEALRGTPLAGGPGGLASDVAFARAGAAIARLHGGPPEGLRQGGTGDAISRLEERAAAIAAWPACGARVAPIVSRLLTSATMLDRRTLVAAHGDLHGRNILLDGDRVALIDLDEAIVDPPARDLGHFRRLHPVRRGRERPHRGGHSRLHRRLPRGRRLDRPDGRYRLARRRLSAHGKSLPRGDVDAAGSLPKNRAADYARRAAQPRRWAAAGTGPRCRRLASRRQAERSWRGFCPSFGGIAGFSSGPIPAACSAPPPCWRHPGP